MSKKYAAVIIAVIGIFVIVVGLFTCSDSAYKINNTNVNGTGYDGIDTVVQGVEQFNRIQEGQLKATKAVIISIGFAILAIAVKTAAEAEETPGKLEVKTPQELEAQFEKKNPKP